MNSFYVNSLFIAIPIFIILIIVEMFFSKVKGIKINNHSDMISSLSSGMSNTIRDAFKFGIVIVSYAWMVDKIAIFVSGIFGSNPHTLSPFFTPFFFSADAKQET